MIKELANRLLNSEKCAIIFLVFFIVRVLKSIKNDVYLENYLVNFAFFFTKYLKENTKN